MVLSMRGRHMFIAATWLRKFVAVMSSRHFSLQPVFFYLFTSAQPYSTDYGVIFLFCFENFTGNVLNGPMRYSRVFPSEAQRKKNSFSSWKYPIEPVMKQLSLPLSQTSILLSHTLRLCNWSIIELANATNALYKDPKLAKWYVARKLIL